MCDTLTIYCDWCGKPVIGYYTGEDNTISCRPCLDKGADICKLVNKLATDLEGKTYDCNL